jgi:hypothetical protein
VEMTSSVAKNDEAEALSGRLANLEIDDDLPELYEKEGAIVASNPYESELNDEDLGHSGPIDLDDVASNELGSQMGGNLSQTLARVRDSHAFEDDAHKKTASRRGVYGGFAGGRG